MPRTLISTNTRAPLRKREEYEPHIDLGAVIYAGVDYERILREAEKEADVIVWDGGNNDLPFYQPDLHIVVDDPHRPGHDLTYHPGETNLRLADVVIINKIDTADLQDIATVRRNIRSVNPKATIIEAARRLQDCGPNIIDLNLGCYVRKIAERGAGSGMLRDPAKIARLFARLTRALRVRVTAKIRLGWDEQTRNYLEVARILEENGASLIAVHARTKAQGYTGVADWNAIAEIKQAVKIPVIGNGDVKTVADIARIKAQTGCDGVMIGRAAVGNPWIFSRKDREQVEPSKKIALLRRHLSRHLEFYGERAGLILFRKHAYRYVQGGRGSAAIRHALMLCSDVREFERLVDEYARATIAWGRGICPTESLWAVDFRF
jgi:nifR3 family TIM-barrel protein